jgi:hypothetical protein
MTNKKDESILDDRKLFADTRRDIFKMPGGARSGRGHFGRCWI